MDNQIVTCSCFILLLFIINLSKGYDAKCPDRESVCMTLGKCTSLVNLLKHRPIPFHSRERLNKALCGFDGIHPNVCCPPNELNVTNVTTTQQRNIPTNLPDVPHTNLLPTLNECGYFFEDRIYLGNETQLDSYPWTVLLEYKTPTGNGFHCGGVLINNRYVLTAAHCISGYGNEASWELVSVRLGEYDKESDRDCDNYLFSQIDCCCADDVVNIGIQETIVHEDFDRNNEGQYYDIALLRLTEHVRFSDFIRPICLQPANNLAAVSKLGESATISGWGVRRTHFNSNKKHWGKLEITNNSECEAFQQLPVRDDQICAFAVDTWSSCAQDSGGALMNLISSSFQNYYAIGVMSRSYHDVCGLKKYPLLYTKVENYFQWIISKLRP